jgi:hypothetical protein
MSLPLPGMELQFVGHPARCRVTVLTELSAYKNALLYGPRGECVYTSDVLLDLRIFVVVLFYDPFSI